MAMICSALFLTIAPLVYVPQERGYLLLGLALVLTGVPVYLLLVWDKYRPALISRITGKYSVMIVVHVYQGWGEVHTKVVKYKYKYMNFFSSTSTSTCMIAV